MSFLLFQQLLSKLFTHPEAIDVDTWNEFYVMYKEGCEKYKQTPIEWAEEFFQDFNEKDHDYMLKSQVKK